MTVHLDISQLVVDPRRSGIQRAERELIRHWPGPATLVPCRFDPARGSMTALPPGIFEPLCQDAPPGGLAAELARIEPFLQEGPVVTPRRLLNAELFADASRAAWYRARPEACRAYWLVYDFLPWLRPDWFGVGAAAAFMPYLLTLRSVHDRAFISAQTRREFETRIARKPAGGPVIPMGGDGLGLEPQTFDPARASFVMLGTVEPRKNALPAMQAFRELWRQGVDARLSMVGLVAPDAAAEIALLQDMERDSRFRLLRDLSDHGVREELRSARAMLFPSEGEGFGIPPMEALHAGMPVIVAASLPALAGERSCGQLRLSPVSASTIGSAVLAMMDDARAARLWREASSMRPPTWRDFAHKVAEWVQA